MSRIPRVIKDYISEFISGVGSDEVASQAPVQSVDGETGDVTISVPVDSVNGETGTVTLSAADVNALADTYSAPVQSVSGATGDISDSDIDHNQTANRDHSGDDITPSSVSTDALEADTLNGADVLNASENQILVAQGDGSLSVETQSQGPNPYDQTQSFLESGLTVSNTSTQIANESISLDNSTVVDDVEDDDIVVKPANWSGWSGSTSALSSQSSTVLSGSFSLKYDSGGSQLDVVANRDSNNSPNEVSLLVQIDNQTGDFVDTLLEIQLLLNSQDDAMTASFTGDGNFVNMQGSWSTNTTYKVRFYNIDYSNNEYDIEVIRVSDSMQVASVSNEPFDFNTNDIGYIDLISDAPSGTSAYIDNVLWGSSALSGSATIEWDRGIPTDIFEWDVATFTTTLDGETVDVFVAYSNDSGSTWTRLNGGSAISRSFSLNDEQDNVTAFDADSDVRIEAELSRSDTANNPTLDSAYRSWFV